MAEISISDGVSVSGELEIRDDSPLARANVTQLVTVGRELLANFTKPLDQVDVRSFALGAKETSSSFAIGDLSLALTGGIGGELSVFTTADRVLFAEDGFSPVVPIATGEAWVGVDFDLLGSATLAASIDGLGVSFAGKSRLSYSSYLLFSSQGSPLPSLHDATADALSNFTFTTSAASIRAQAPNTVNVVNLGGSIAVAASLKQPFTLNPLASASLPLNLTASLQPTVTAELVAKLTLSGEFVVRSYKLSATRVRLGVYKKRGSTLGVSITAGAGLAGNVDDTDVLSALLNATLPGIDVAAAGITGDTAAALNGAIKDGLDRSLSAQMNATCSAARTDEAAVLYDLQLDQGDAGATDRALGRAMRGDWSALETLPNARRLRNIAVETSERRQALTVNLFGFYSASSVTDYVRKSTMLVDESGQLSWIDKLDTQRISLAANPTMSDPEKLRRALMEDFVCTATYVAVAGGLQFKLTALQSYFDYNRSMGRAEMRQNLQLAYALGLLQPGALDAMLAATPTFPHATVSANVRYSMDAVLSIFYKDPGGRTAWQRDEVERKGREVMARFLDPADGTDAVRLRVLADDATWRAMDDIGNTAAFHTIAGLSHLGPTQLAAVSTDWVGIAWWAEAVSRVAPALTTTLQALDDTTGQNPADDPAFLRERANLANVLGAVTRKTDAAFVHGWGAAVLFILSGKRGAAAMDITWDSQHLQYASPLS